MARIQIHKDSGVNAYDESTGEMLYQDSFEMAVADAEMPAMNWPDPSIVRVFELTDGRLAIVRDTPSGLNQEAAPKHIQQLFAQMKSKADLMNQNLQARIIAEQEAGQL